MKKNIEYQTWVNFYLEISYTDKTHYISCGDTYLFWVTCI